MNMGGYQSQGYQSGRYGQQQGQQFNNPNYPPQNQGFIQQRYNQPNQGYSGPGQFPEGYGQQNKGPSQNYGQGQFGGQYGIGNPNQYRSNQSNNQ